MDRTRLEAEPPAHEVAAVVVNYNAGKALTECVASLKREGVSVIVVVDNGSTDGSLEYLAATNPDVQVLHTGRNLGFGGGVNYGARRTSGELLLVCNPDLELQSGALRAMVDRLTNDPSLGLVGPALVTPAGDLQPSGRAFPTLRPGRDIPRERLQPSLPRGELRPGRNRDRGLGDGSVLAGSPRCL
jgi:GT2 family glycosyltransferase